MKYDIFISYRREGGYDTAKHINDLLVRDGYKVSFDIDTLRNGDFDMQLLDRIKHCKDFILIVDEHAFERTVDPNFDRNKDWLRCELAYALKLKKNIIPVFLSGVTGFPDGLPEDVKGVIKKHGPEYNRFYFDDFYKKLKSRFLKSRSNKRIIALTLSFMLLIAAVLFYCFNTSEPDILIYQNPSNPQTTSKELFDKYVAANVNDLVSDTLDYSNNPDRLLEYWTLRAQTGDREAQFNVGLLMYNNHNKTDLSKAIDYFKLAAEQEYPQALYALAVCYNKGICLKQNSSRATELYYQAAKLNYAPAQNDYSISCLTSSKPMDSTEIFAWLEKSAKQGYAPAQYHLSCCYFNGFGVKKDIDLYYYWIKQSADQGYDFAQYNLAGFYLGAPEQYRNLELGVEMLQTLVNEDFKYAYYNLAQCYAHGIVVDKDTATAYQLLKDGAERKDPICICEIGSLYFNPIPGTTERNYEKGLELLKEAANYGYPVAQYYLGVVYQQGLGVAKDLKKAQKWFDIAAQQNATHQTVNNRNNQVMNQ